MEIIINADLETRLKISDKEVINSWDKNLTKKEMIENISLSAFEPSKNAQEKLSEISRLIKEDNNLQIQTLNLDIRGKRKSVEFSDIWKGENVGDSVLSNIAFIFRLSKTFLDEFNSFVLFTTIENIKKESIEITMNRIEYMNIPFVEKEIFAIYNGQAMLDFVFNKTKSVSRDPNLIDLLSKTKKITRNLPISDSKEKFKFKDWNDLIFSLYNFFSYKDKKVNDEVFVLDESLTILHEAKDFDKKTIFLCQESKIEYSKKSRNLFLDDGNDKSIPIKIINSSEVDLVKIINKQISDTKHLISKWKNECEEILLEENGLKDEREKIKSNLWKIKEEINLDQKKLLKKDRNDNLNIKLEEDDKILENYNLKIEACSNRKKECLNKINDQDKKINNYKMVLNYLSDKRFNSISELLISSNYSEKETNKRVFKISNIYEVLSTKPKLDWILSNNDIGKIQIIKRYKSSFTNINKGFYKNPYLFYSLLSIPEINQSEMIKENKWKRVNELIKEKYNLNDDQKKVVEKSINMRDIFYLQGPPGTGKTQTICAITEEYTNYKNNVLMTSSTHEAINNFFDRLHEENMANPNLILLKYRAYFPEEKFSENTIYKLFLEKICNFTLKQNDSEDKVKAYEKYVKNYGKICPELPTNFELDLLQKEFNTTGNINSYINGRFNKIFEELKLINLLEGPKFIENLKLFIKMKKNNNGIESQWNDWTIITKSVNKIILDFREVESIFEKKSQNYFEKMMIAFKKHINNNEKIDETNFLKYVKKHRLINVIGISTTSKTSFEILGENVNLFSEYPIDLVIIDEISKSTTPEILGRVILAKKVIFSGDYKQLPPITAFQKEECKEFFDDKHFEDLINEKKLNNADELYYFINDLHTTSFFRCEIESVKSDMSINTSNRPYHNLRVQHRFTNNIMNCVNHFYDDDEQLKMPQNQIKWNNYELGFQKGIGNGDISLFDTSYMSKSFSNKVRSSGISLSDPINGNYSSFDSNSSYLENNNFLYPSKINEYNAEVIMNIVGSLINLTQKEKLVNKIGIICMTESQKKIIEKQINEHLHNALKIKIKIDTVDNFQGREKDIIIVDFVRSWNSLEGKHISSKKRNLEFYTVLERINVALSRAKSKLILVGAFENHYMDRKTISKGSEKIDFFTDIYKSVNNLDSIIKTWEGFE